MNTVCNFGLSSRSSLIASFRSAAAGDENRAPWVLAPGEALQVNNKQAAAAPWGGIFNCGILRWNLINSPSRGNVCLFFTSKD